MMLYLASMTILNTNLRKVCEHQHEIGDDDVAIEWSRRLTEHDACSWFAALLSSFAVLRRKRSEFFSDESTQTQ